MTENFKILAEFIKDISSETPNIESYIYVKENISKYQLNKVSVCQDYPFWPWLAAVGDNGRWGKWEEVH